MSDPTDHSSAANRPTSRLRPSASASLVAAGLALASLLAPGCAHRSFRAPESAAATSDAALPEDFARVLRDYEAAWSAKDAKALAALFAEDGFVLPNGGTPVRGRAAIEAHYAASGGPLALRALDWAACGDVGFMIGLYGRERGAESSGKFTLTLRREGDGGRWLIVSDMDSPNARPQR
jgi:ketosteroid isomerase-like protein